MVIEIDSANEPGTEKHSSEDARSSEVNKESIDGKSKVSPGFWMFRKRRHSQDGRLQKLKYETIDEYPLGYPRLAAFISSDKNFTVYRRYGTLRHRLLLHKQQELFVLERKLKELDDADDDDTEHGTGKRWRIESVTRDVMNEDKERRELLEEIDKKLEDYDKLLLREQKLMGLAKPTERNHRNILNFLWEENPIITAESEYINQVDDCVILTNNQDSPFEASVENWISFVPSRRFRDLFSTTAQRARTNDPTIRLFSKERINYLVSLITGLVLVALLAAPVSLLIILQTSDQTKILIVITAMLVFVPGLVFFSRARNQEIFTIIVGYCAVLVVFLGNLVKNRSVN